MYARQFAPVCLLCVGAVAAPSERMFEGSNEIAVYSRPATRVSAGVREAMQQETGKLMESGGFRVRWLDKPREVAAAFLAVVDFEGSCNPSSDAVIQPATQRLASTAVENARILPFINIDCTALQQFVAPALRGKLNPNPQFLYGRALGRLLAHELYHLVSQTTDHTSVGVARAAVSVSDLISDRFTFGAEALLKIHAHRTSSALTSIKAGVDMGSELDLR
jgi:hypothetical protein